MPFPYFGLLRRARNLIFALLATALAAAAAQQLAQTITFPAIPDQFLGVSPFPITAHSDSNLPVSFSSTTPSICASAGAWVLPRAVGSCTIEASQAGNGGYLAATPVPVTFNILPPLPAGTMGFAGQTGSRNTNPNGVAVADFDHDGHMDAAITGNPATPDNSNLTIMFGGGTAIASTSIIPLNGDILHAVAAGDFNNDGNPDLVVAATNVDGSSFLVPLIGQGTGVLTPQSAINGLGLGTPTAITVGDFNGDGNQDVAVAYANGRVATLTGDGAGRLTVLNSSAILLSQSIASIVSVDINHDGFMDLIFAIPASNQVYIYTADSGGAFSLAAQPLLGSNTGPNALAVGDFNNDGNPDFAVTLGAVNQVAFFTSNSSGSFAEVGVRATVGTGPMSIVAADFDGDGHQDLAVGDTGASNDGVHFLLGDGAGNFSDAFSSPEYPTSSSGNIYIAAGDFNNDQREDVLAVNGTAATLVVWTGALAPTTTTLSTTVPSTIVQGAPVPLTATVTASGQYFVPLTGAVTFTDNQSPMDTIPGGSPYQYTAPSLNYGPHNLTALFTSTAGFQTTSSNPLSITALNNQTISFPALSNQGYGDSSQTLSAFSDSGLPITYSTTTSSVCTPVGGEIPHVNVLTLGLCTIIASQPGDSNYVAAQDVTRSFTVGKGTQNITFNWPNGIHFVGTAPFLAPASSDSGLPVTIVSDTPAVCKASGSLIQPIAPGLCQLTASQPGNAFFNPALSADAYAGISVSVPSGKLSPDASTLSTGNIPTSAALADFDGDGRMDLAVVNHNDHSVSVFLQSEAGVFTSAGAFEMSPAIDAIVAGDFNGDGFPDLAVTSASSANVTVLLNNTGGAFTQTFGPFSLAAAPGGIALGDFNSDGVTDLIVSEPSLGNVVILAGDGHGSFASFGNPIAAGTAPGSIAVADFDGDGNQDIVVDDDASARAIVLRGNGAGVFTPVTAGGPFTAGASLAAVTVADFNNDGHADFAIASPSDHKVGVWLWNGVDGFIASLGSPFLLPSGAGPLAAVDFDGDGHLDLAVADSAGSIQVLLGDGTGNFAPALNTFPAGNGINAIVAGDIDGDGTIGLAVVNAVGNTVTFLRGGPDTVTGTLTSNSASSVPYGTPIDLTLTLTPSNAAFRVPSGTAFFSESNDAFFTESADTISPFHATGTALPGTYAISASFIGTPFTQLFQSSPITRTITQLSQSITFSTLSDQPFGTQSVDISGAASAPGGSIHFTSNSTNICQVEGTLVSLLNVGLCTIQADQSGDAIYTPAASKTQSFNITAAPQTITFHPIPTKILGTAPFVVAAEADSHLPVVVTSATASVCRTASTLITLLATGTCTIDATQPGDANHSSATISRSFSVIRSSVAGTMSAPAGTPVSLGDFTQPFAVAVGDFNEDGVPDLATAGNQSGTVSIAFGSLSGGSYSATLDHQQAVGSGPVSIVAADLNGDGHLDLVMPDSSKGRLDILLGQGNGTFVFGDTPVSGALPSAIAVADLNGDGIPDLVAANASDNNIALLKNDGTGSFTATYLALGSSPAGLAIGDFNKDGRQDLAVTSSNGNGNILTVFAGVGDGSFTTPGTALATGPSPQGVTVIDYDNDGNSDLAVANNDTTISLFKGDGLGGFSAAGTPIAINSAVSAIVAGDFNGDGFPDLAAPSIAGGSVSIMLGDGQGHFAVKSAGAPPQAGWGLAEFDLNGDGFDDLAITNLNGNTVSILQGGLAASQSDLTTTSPLSIPANSTIPLVVNVTSPNGAFVPPTGTVTFKEGLSVLGTSPDSTSPYTFTTPPLAPGQHTITAYYGGGSGSGISNSQPLTFTALVPQTITFAPLGDRPMDPLPIQLTATSDSGLGVLFESTTSSVCSISKGSLTLLSVGQCSITATQPGDDVHEAAQPVTRAFNISIASQSIHFGNILHPTVGLPPFEVPVQASSLLPVTVTSLTTNVCRVSANLVRAVTAGTCTLQASQAGNANYNPSPVLQSSFLIKTAAPSGYLASGGSIAIAGGSPVGIATGDFNNDGFSDLAVLNTSTSSVSVLLGDASGALTPLSTTFPTPAGPLSLAAGDFNADGYSDVAVMTASDGSITTLLGGPGGALTPAPGNPSAPGLNAYAMAVGDFNGDGIEDLATVNSAGGQLTILAGNGQGAFARLSQTEIGGTVIALAVGDFDRNGKQDVVVVDIENNKAYLLLGDGNGGFQGSPVSLPVGNSPIDVSVGDFDANGNPDLAVVNQADSSVTLLIGDGQGGFQPASSSPLTTGLAPQTVVVGDFSGDGLADIGVGAPGGFTLLKNGGSLNFAQAAGSPFTLPLAYKAVIADFNNDGRLDVAAMNASSDHIQILLGANAPTTSTLSLASPSPFPLGADVPFTLTVANTGTSVNPISGTATLISGAATIATATETTSPFSFTAGGFTPGNHTVTAHFAGAAGNADSDSNSVTFDIQQTQTILLGPVSDVALVSSPIHISATATSGLPVSFSSGNTSICTVEGTTVTLVAAGQCTIKADQSGDLNWAPATQVAVQFNIAATAQQTITFPVIPNQIYGAAPFVIAAKSDSGLPVTLTSTTTNVCRLAGTLVTILTSGACDIEATQAGNQSYDPASPATREFLIANAAPAGILTAFPVSPITTAGAAPAGVAAADLDHNGRIDFVVADNPNHRVTVLLSNGEGDYNATQFDTGVAPEGVTIADFDRDGNPDFAAVNSAAHTVTVYRGDGLGGFTQVEGSAFGAGLISPNRAVAGDFNGDGIPDLAVSSDTASGFSIMTGIGDGTFNAGVPHSVGGTASAIAVGDFNRDGHQDLAIALADNTVIVQNGDGVGGFTADTNGPFGVGTGPVAIVAGDFNNDGKTDLATANTTAGTVSILIGDGAGNFATPSVQVAAGTSPASIALGDYNGDGFVDLVVAHKSATAHDVGVLLNNGDGSFRTGPNFDLGSGTPDTVVAADFDNDGAIDLAVTNQTGGALTLFRGALNPTSTSVSTISPLTVGPGAQIPLDIAVSHTGAAEYELPHGFVTVFDGQTQLGSASQTVTPYTFLTPVLSAGSHTLAAVYGGDQRSLNSPSNALVIQVLASQSITFSQPSDVQISAGSVTLSASATSNLPVSFNSDTSLAICQVSGNVVTLNSAGTCTVTATQGGDANYAAAPSIQRSFLVSKSPQSITFAQPSDVQLSAGSLAVSASASSNLPVSFNSDTTLAICQVSGNLVTLNSAGTCTVTATQDGDANYAAAPSISRSFLVSTSPQTITFAPILPHYFGDSPFPIAAQASSFLPVTLTSGTTSVCKLTGDLVVVLGPGTCTLQAAQNGNGSFVPAQPVTRSFAVRTPGRSGALTPSSIGPYTMGHGPDAGPTTVALADFDGDGLADFATANTAENSVSIMLADADGSGGFHQAPGSPYSILTGPIFVATGDFNGDAKQDIAILKNNGSLDLLLGRGDGTFDVGTPVTVGSSPQSIAVGDLNGDNIEDIVVAETGIDAVRILKGDGSGHFTSTLVSANKYPYALALGDYDGDGVPDIAVANNDGHATVLINHLAEGFNASQFVTDNGSDTIVAADFNHDGYLDLAVGNAGASTVTFLINDTTGGFASNPANSVTLPSWPESLSAGDYNGDATPDLAIVTSSGVVTALGVGDGTFTTQVGGNFAADLTPTSGATWDFNNDGFLDLLTVTQSNSQVHFQNGGRAIVSLSLSTTAESTVTQGTPVPLSATITPTTPVFRTPAGSVIFFDGDVPLGTATQNVSPWTFTANDLSQGSHSLFASYEGDLQTAAQTSEPVTVAVQANLISQTITFGPLSDRVQGSGNVTLTATASSGLPVIFSTTSTACSVTENIVTLSGAGTCAIKASQPGDKVYAPASDVIQQFAISLPQTISFDTIPGQILGTSPFTSAAQASSGLAVTLTSLTTDVCKTASNLITILSSGSCQIQATQPGGVGYAAAAPVTRTFEVNQALPGGVFTSAAPIAAGAAARAAVVGDFNGDHTPDLAVADASIPGNVKVLFGSAFSSAGDHSVGSNPSSVAVGDFDVDGKLDLVTPNPGDNSVSVLRGDGAGGFSVSSISQFAVPEAVAIGDFNGDGAQDLAVANSSTKTITIEFGVGDGTFILDDAGPFATGTQPSAIAMGDFNGDGKQDLAVANQGSNDVTVLLGNATGSFTPAPGSPYAVGIAPVQLAVGDFNHDGVSDLAVANSGGTGNISVLKGNGDGSFTAFPGTPLGAGKFEALAVSDFNGDGKPDIAAAAYAQSGSVSIFLGDGNGGFSALPSTFAVGALPTSLVATDLNADGIADLVATNSGDGTVSVLLGAAAPIQSPQTITFAPLSNVQVGAHVDLSATASSSLTVTFESSTTSICTISGTSATAIAAGTCTIVASQGGNANFAPASASRSFEVTAPAPPQQNPQTISFSSPGTVTFGVQPFTISATASSGLAVTFSSGTPAICSVTANLVSVLAAGTCSITALQSGNDSFAAADPVTQSFTVLSPVTVTTSSLPNGAAGVSYSATLAAKGGNGGPYSWSAAPGSLPQGIGLGSNGVLTGNPSAAGTFTFTVQASDGVSPPASASLSITIFGQLSITTTSLPNGIVGSTYGPQSLSAKGGSGSFTWAASGLPGGLTLSAAGSLSGTPAAAGDSLVSFTATDTNTGQTLTAKIPLSVVSASTILQASPSSLTAGAASGAAITGSFTASGGTPPYKFTASGLPAGISLSESGALSGSSSTAGTYSATVTVTDSATTPATATAQLTIHIFGITSESLSTGAATAFYTSAFNAAGGTPPIVFSASGLPAGLSLNGAGALTGTVDAPGALNFTVQAADSAGLTSSRVFTLTIGKAPVSAKALSLPDGTVGAPYSGALKAAGGTTPYSWSLISGALPAGLSLSSSGAVSGIPTAPGTTTIGVQVTDSTGGVASGGVSITIAPAPVVISTGALPTGVVNFYYGPQIIDITGGVAPYTFALSGSLPTGLTLSGNVISGTPAAAGTFPFTLKVTDSAGNKADAQSSILIRPPASDLLLLSGSVSFSLAQGSTVLPSAQSVGVQSTVVADSITWTGSANPGASWLTVTGSGTTPGAVTIALNNAALSLPAGSNSATVTVTCTSSTCQGKSQTIAVSLNISSPPPQLGIGDGLLSFNSVSMLSQPIQIQNIGGGVLTVSSVSCGAPWCSVGSFSSSLTGGASTQVTIGASATGLASGFYRTTVDITSSAGSVSIPVTFLVTQNAIMTLAPSGTRFDMAAGGKPGNVNGSFGVVAAGGAITWSAAPKGDAPWLTLVTAAGSSSNDAPGPVTYSINSSAASLAPGAYYATIEVTSSDASNSPQDYQIVLNVAPVGAPPHLTPNPAGLTFDSRTTSQVITVYSTSSGPTAYQASAATADGGKWLSVTPTGSASSSAPGTSTVTIKTAGLAGGVYSGSISFAAGGSGISTVSVSAVIPASAPVSLATPAGGPTPRDSCSAVTVVPTQIGLINSFSAPASWPTPISVQLSDDCGRIINNGQVIATFSNGDPPLPFTVSDPAKGVYTGTWTPRNSTSRITIKARGSKTGLTPATAQLSGAVVPNAAPSIDDNGVVHPYDPLIGGALSPGTIVAIYGSHLASQVAQPSSIPLPVKLNGTSVLIGGVPSPLFYVSPSQINVQIPFELDASGQYQVVVNANGALTPPQQVQLTQANPGLDTFPDGSLVAVHASDGTLISATSPAQRGEYVVLFALGLGATDNPVATGDGSSGTVLSRVTVQPTITMNSNPVPISFAGLTPGFVGLYQVNLQIPDNQPGGNVVVGVSQGDTAGNSGILPIAY